MLKEKVIGVAILLLILMIAGLATYYFVVMKTHVSDEAAASKAFKTEEGVSSYTNLEGEEQSFEDYLGDVIVVTSWASWCPQCSTDLPKLSILAEEYDAKGVHFLAVNRSEDRYTAERFLSSLTDTNNLEIILDPSDRFFKANDGYAMPENIIYSKEGEILLHQRGELRVEEVRNILEQTLK